MKKELLGGQLGDLPLPGLACRTKPKFLAGVTPCPLRPPCEFFLVIPGRTALIPSQDSVQSFQQLHNIKGLFDACLRVDISKALIWDCGGGSGGNDDP